MARATAWQPAQQDLGAAAAQIVSNPSSAIPMVGASGAIGGVMGGAETEISPYTKNVLLECAWFDPISIRRTSKALNLRTEASTRFERALDRHLLDIHVEGIQQ